MLKPKEYSMKEILLLSTLILLPTAVLSEDLKPIPVPSPVAVIEQNDLAEISKTLDEQVPPKWSRPMVEFLNRLIARQQKAQELGGKK
jgi:hypothetical protein